MKARLCDDLVPIIWQHDGTTMMHPISNLQLWHGLPLCSVSAASEHPWDWQATLVRQFLVTYMITPFTECQQTV